MPVLSCTLAPAVRVSRIGNVAGLVSTNTNGSKVSGSKCTSLASPTDCDT